MKANRAYELIVTKGNRLDPNRIDHLEILDLVEAVRAREAARRHAAAAVQDPVLAVGPHAAEASSSASCTPRVSSALRTARGWISHAAAAMRMVSWSSARPPA